MILPFTPEGNQIALKLFEAHHRDIILTRPDNLDVLTESELMGFIWQACLSTARRMMKDTLCEAHIKNYLLWVFRKRANKAVGQMYRYEPPPMTDIEIDAEKAEEHKLLLSELMEKYGSLEVLRMARVISLKEYAQISGRKESTANRYIAKLKTEIRAKYTFQTSAMSVIKNASPDI